MKHLWCGSGFHKLLMLEIKPNGCQIPEAEEMYNSH
jgi:hypothetical protein